MTEHLTRDNLLLSRATKEVPESEVIAVDCTNQSVAAIAGYVRASISDNTRLAYLSDLKQFESWGGQIPADPDTVASYLASQAETLSVATLVRRLAAIAKAHRAHGLASPTSAEIVKATMRGIRRTKGVAQREAKPLLKAELLLALEAIGHNLKGVRDRALLLLGFAGGFRRSELVGLDVGDVETVRQGLIIHLRHSKVDQDGYGRKIGIPFGRTRACPVAAVADWLGRSQITEGALFRPINRHSQILLRRLSGEAVSSVVKESVAHAGYIREKINEIENTSPSK